MNGRSPDAPISFLWTLKGVINQFLNLFAPPGKSSIRLLKPDGRAGITMLEWLEGHGLEAPRSHKKAELTLDAVRRRQSLTSLKQRTPAAAEEAEHLGKAAHREGCMCIICKQVGGGWGSRLAVLLFMFCDASLCRSLVCSDSVH